MRYIIRGIENGKSYILKDLGLPEDLYIHRVWTILNEDEDMMVVKLRHWYNAFLEDKSHDWDLWQGVFRYHPHSSEIGEKCDIIIISEWSD